MLPLLTGIEASMFWRFAAGFISAIGLLLKGRRDSFGRKRYMQEEQRKMQAVSFIQQSYFGTDLTYRVSQERGHTVTRFSSAKFLDQGIQPVKAGEESPVPPSPAPPASPQQPPSKIIVFPSRSDEPQQPSSSPAKAPGEVVVFPSQPKASRPNYALLDKVLEELLSAETQIRPEEN